MKRLSTKFLGLLIDNHSGCTTKFPFKVFPLHLWGEKNLFLLYFSNKILAARRNHTCNNRTTMSLLWKKVSPHCDEGFTLWRKMSPHCGEGFTRWRKMSSHYGEGFTRWRKVSSHCGEGFIRWRKMSPHCGEGFTRWRKESSHCGEGFTQ
jgi:ribosomal protein S27AE